MTEKIFPGAGAFAHSSKLFALFLTALLLLSGCANSPQKSSVMSNLLLAEPEPTSQRSQMVIARYTHILYQAPLSDEEKAELLFQRGVAYDAIGLTTLAMLDYNEAIRLKPDLAAAYNSVGVHYIQQGEFIQAYEAFDSTLDINPEYEFALLNRGIALYYGGRSELANIDTSAFWERDKSDPYRVLWDYITLADVSPVDAIDELREKRQYLDENNWATAIVDFYLGKGTEATVIARLLEDVASQAQLNNRLCEAYFYLGKYHAARGNKNVASNYFKLSLSTNVHEYVEHKYSRLELLNLRSNALAQ